MRTLVIGDIHGCSRALDALLTNILPAPADLVIALGDFVDWGPDSRGVLDRLIELGRQTHLVGLRGNHEEMMLRSRDNQDEYAIWLRAGGDATLRSYGGEPIPSSHWDFIEQTCLDVYESPTHVFVHGGLNPDLPVNEQPVYVFRWKTFREVRPHCSGKVMVCGHSTQRNGRPRSIGHAICIDTGVSCGGWLTCLEPASGAYWQANERKESRHGRLESDAPQLTR